MMRSNVRAVKCLQLIACVVYNRHSVSLQILKYSEMCLWIHCYPHSTLAQSLGTKP